MVPFRKVGGQSQGPPRGVPCRGDIRKLGFRVQKGAGPRELGPGLREGRIECHRLLIEATGALKVTEPLVVCPGRLAFEERYVGGEVFGWLLAERVALLRTQCHVERLRYLSCDFSLYREDIGHRRIEWLLPF